MAAVSSRSSGGGGSRGYWSGGDDRIARVGAADKGRRRLPHLGLEAVSSTRPDHGWVREGEEMERMGGRKVSEMNWNEK